MLYLVLCVVVYDSIASVVLLVYIVCAREWESATVCCTASIYLLLVRALYYYCSVVLRNKYSYNIVALA